MTADSKIKIWDEKHKTAVAEASKRQSEFDAANSSSNFPTEYLNLHKLISLSKMVIAFTGQNLSLADKLVKEDIDGTLECLQMFDKQFTDVKTFYDVILYPTNDGWKCAIDISLDVSYKMIYNYIVIALIGHNDAGSTTL